MSAFPLFSLFAFLLLLLLLPMLFGELMATSLVKLHLSPEAALLLMVAIIAGGLVNIPVKRIAHERVIPAHPLAVFGLGGLWPGMRRERRETIIAVNFGGCVIPTGLALYELLQLAARGAPALWAVLIAGIVNIAVVPTLPLQQRLRARARELAVEWRDINGLVPYARNARTHSEAQIAQIAGSIGRFGRYGRLVSCPYWPTRRIAGFASLKGSPSLFPRCFFSHFGEKFTAR